MMGVPARQTGWMSRFGKRLTLPVEGEGTATCPHTNETYQLKNSQCSLLDNAEA
ncbi:MAG: hypothetical protein R8K22_03200 [Mariprofundaceae bacterium]